MIAFFFANSRFSEALNFSEFFLHFSEPLDFCENMCSRYRKAIFIAAFSEAIYIFEIVHYFKKILNIFFEISGIRNFVSKLNSSKPVTLEIRWQQSIN